MRLIAKVDEDSSRRDYIFITDYSYYRGSKRHDVKNEIRIYFDRDAETSTTAVRIRNMLQGQICELYPESLFPLVEQIVTFICENLKVVEVENETFLKAKEPSDSCNTYVIFNADFEIINIVNGSCLSGKLVDCKFVIFTLQSNGVILFQKSRAKNQDGCQGMLHTFTIRKSDNSERIVEKFVPDVINEEFLRNLMLS